MGEEDPSSSKGFGPLNKDTPDAVDSSREMEKGGGRGVVKRKKEWKGKKEETDLNRHRICTSQGEGGQ